MRFKAFECYGVKVFEKGEWLFTKYFDELKEAIEYSRDVASWNGHYEIYTSDKYGNVIDRLV